MSQSIRSGIYAITRIASGKQYIGSSYDVVARMGKHREQLRGNRHHCKHLQNAWNKYGEAEFTFEIIELFSGDKADLCAREQEWLDRFYDKGELYNSSPSANPLAALWHESEEGKVAHEEQRKNTIEWWSNREYRELTCEHCGSKFQTRDSKNKDTRFCSNNCRTYAAIPKYTEERQCEFCHQTYKISRYRPHRFCSKTCGLHARHGKVTFEVLMEILGELAAKISPNDIAKKFDVQVSTVYHLGKPKFWRKLNISEDLRIALEACRSEDTSQLRKDAGAESRAKLKRKFTDDQVKEIRIRIANGEKLKSIAKHYGVSHTIISYIKTWKSYKHVQYDPSPLLPGFE